MILYYCNKCGIRIQEKDIISGAICVLEGCAKCLKCAPTRKLTPAKGHKIIRTPRKELVQLPLLSPSNTTQWLQGRIRQYVVLSASAACFIFFGTLLILKTNKPKTSSALSESTPTERTAPPPVEQPNGRINTNSIEQSSVEPSPVLLVSDEKDPHDPRSVAALAVLLQIKAFYANHPTSTNTYKNKLKSFLERFKKTPAAREAERMLNEENSIQVQKM